jgi:curved DNA-binding protein CbpA
MMAWEVLGDEQKRKQYDQNAGFISELKSISTTLTPYNYNYLVEESNSMWLIQVFDSTSTYSKYFSQFWE